jgi:Ser/Thr protein kinase RdoA (MazF antagonist)
MTTKTPEFCDSEILQLLQVQYQLSGQLTKLPGYCDLNLLLTTKDRQKYIVKVANSDEPLLALEMQNAAMAHLSKKQCAVPRALTNLQGESISKISDRQQQTFCLRVLSFISGNFYADATATAHNAALWSDLGRFSAELDLALNDFQHPGAYRYLDWDLAQGYAVCMSKKHLLKVQQANLVDQFLTLYHNQTRLLLAELPQGVIHNDANDYNLLVDDKKQPSKITGIIDFGDMLHTHIINELAIACAYALMGQSDVLTPLCEIVAGYHQLRPLQDAEIEVLYSLIDLRLCTSVCNAALAIQQQPDNQYLLVSQKPAWQLLELLSKLPANAVLCQLRKACGLAVDSGQSKDDIIRYRNKHLGKTLA